VGEMGQDGELLRVCRSLEQSPARRIDLNLDTAWRIGWVGTAAFRNPLPQDRIRCFVFCQLQATAVRHLHLRLIEQQAVIRAERVCPPAEVFTNQSQSVENRVKGPQGQTKATFSAR